MVTKIRFVYGVCYGACFYGVCFLMCLTSQAIRGMSHEDMVRTMRRSQCKIAITSHLVIASVGFETVLLHWVRPLSCG